MAPSTVSKYVRVNSDYYHGAKCRCIYGRDEETLRRSQLLPLAWTPRARSHDVKSGWEKMQRLWQVSQNLHEAQNVVQATALEYAARELVDETIAQAQLQRYYDFAPKTE